MLLRRKMDPKAGRRENRERVTRLLMAVVTTSSTIHLVRQGECENTVDLRTKCSMMFE